MRRLMLVLVAGALAAAFAAPAGPAIADTGTYRIQSYRVDLTPHSDGTVAVDYFQRWLVTGGHIPWITVGTANGNFEIMSSGGAAIEAVPASEGSWSGVRLNLDRDYKPGEAFEVSFSLVQRNLFYAQGPSYKLDFTPGWYDRASIDTLVVSVRFFASLDSVTADPAPTAISGDKLVWGPYGLGAGEHFTVHISFPVALVPGGMAQGNLKRGPGSGGSAAAIIAIIIFIIVILIIISASKNTRRRYSGGHIFYGGIFGGGPGGGRSGGSRSGSGGGGFGGASMSCACACVSCACACACAGGGGAGCARKLEHACPVCGKRRGS